MEGNWWFRRLTLVVVVAVVLGECGGVRGDRIVVGGNRDTWQPNVNYTNWVATQSFYVGNWLMFKFDKYLYDVLEVNKTSYEQCNPQGFITNITKGGRDVFNLTEARTYYFICSKGYCFGGMKVAINVKPAVQSLAVAPSPDRNGAGHYRLVAGGMLLGFLIALVCLF